MWERLYTKTNRFILDAAIVATSFLLAYKISYGGSVLTYRNVQPWVLLFPLIGARLLSYVLLGVERIPWRYFSIRDVFRLVQAQLAVSFVLVALRYIPLPDMEIIRIPIDVIAVEFVLTLSGGLSIRMLRRHLHERRANARRHPPTEPRRLLLIGAGIVGARVAKEMAMHPSIQIVGFLDDDPNKTGCIISGIKVLGTSGLLANLAKNGSIDEVLICVPPEFRSSFHRFAALLEHLPVTGKFMPTIDEIIECNDGFHLSLVPGSGNGNGNGNGHKPQISSAAKPSPSRSEIRNKHILITGGAGFIGSSLAERFAAQNEVVLLDRVFRDQPIQFTSLSTMRNVKMVEADILDGEGVESLVRNAQIIVHAAAIVGVGRVCSHPRETLETNFSGTSRILKALDGQSRLERFIYFSTSEVFGVNSFRVHEDAPSLVGPAAEARWSYAIAKLAGEHLVQAYYRQSGMPVVTVRPFNVFGPRRLGDHAVKRFVLNCLMGKPLEVHGDGSQIRSWCYISDFCDALVEMIARPAAVGQDFNIGNPANTVTVLQLAQQIVEMTRSHVPIKFKEHPFPDIEIRVPSLTKACSILDYKPAHDLTSGLGPTIEWYQKHLPFLEPQGVRAVEPFRLASAMAQPRIDD
jgi:nucleoside-diphosphate-sugar epimerase